MDASEEGPRHAGPRTLAAGRVAGLALAVAEGPRIALLGPGGFEVLAIAPDGGVHGYAAPAGPGPGLAVPGNGRAMDVAGLVRLVAAVAGVGPGAGPFPGPLPGLLERAGLPARIGEGLAAAALIGPHTSAEQRRVLLCDDPRAEGLRRLCLAQPYLADTFWAEACLAARDGGDPLAAAREEADLPGPILRRLAGIPASEFVTAHLTPSPSHLLALLRAIPADWFPPPAQRPDFCAFADILPGLSRRTGTPVSGLLAGCRGDWSALAARCRAGSGTAHDRPLRAAFRDIEDFPNHFADKVVAPLMARSGLAGIRRVSPHARRAAMRAVYRGKGLAGIIEASRRWHALHDRIDAAVPDLFPPDRPWPAPSGTWERNGIRVVPLVTGRQLVEEGASGPDGAGVPGLAHCVGSHRGAARRGECHVVSIRLRSPEGDRRLATAELTVGPDGTASVVQVRGLRNREPPPEAVEALAAYVSQGSPFPATVGPGGDADPTGYDWEDPGALAEAVAAFACALPARLRGLDPDALSEALGIAPQAPAPAP